MLPAIACPIPENESQRLDAVRYYEILDTEPEVEFDALTRVAAHTFGAPIAVVAMLDSDRLWFKSKLGLEVPQLDRKVAFCAHAIMCPREPLVVPDLLNDQRFADNPLVANAPHLRFYAGAPIVDVTGLALGTIAVIDTKPRTFTDSQRHTLSDFATLVITAMQGRRRALALQRMATTAAVQIPITLTTGDQVRVGMSLGIAPYSAATTTAFVLLKEADKALYEAKSQSKRLQNRA